MDTPQPSLTLDRPLSREEVEVLLQSKYKSIGEDVKRRRFPELEAPLRVTDLPLTVRTRNCLQEFTKVRGFPDLRNLSSCTIGELLSSKNFGRKSLDNLFVALIPFIRCTKTHSDEGGTLYRVEVSPSVTRAAER